MLIQEADGDTPTSPRPFPAQYTLRLLDGGMGEIASETFECHYGMDVDAIDLDGDKVPEFAVRLHVGPAVGASVQELKVLRLRDGYLEQVVSMPLAGQAGPSQGWWYNIQYVKRSRRGNVDIRLTLDHGPLEGWDAYVPKDHTRLIRLAKSHTTAEFDQASPCLKGPPEIADSDNGD
jgi:hypothetical protein